MGTAHRSLERLERLLELQSLWKSKGPQVSRVFVELFERRAHSLKAGSSGFLS